MSPVSHQPCLLTVIYPVFDLRGDIVERVQSWAQQNLEPSRFRVVIVASAATALDETALRRVLRNHDTVLRVSIGGREADYWNAGAREATTPWLLFVEAHGVPEQNSLSELAGWIAANPSGVACNFSIGNLEHHRMARFMKRWFAQIHVLWADQKTWPRLHRTACALRRDAFDEAGPFEAAYGQFAPALLSARMNEKGLNISTLPTARIIHEDALEISAHHDDTADYVRGEANARAANDATFFERYFGNSPLQNDRINLSSPRARRVILNALLASVREPRSVSRLWRPVVALLPAALLGLSFRAHVLATLTRLDELLLMNRGIPESLLWKRFLAAHRRVVRTEQLRWLARHPAAALKIRNGDGRWQVQEIDQQAIVGTHAIEFHEETAFRWTLPVVVLRFSFSGPITVTLETRGLRGRVDPSDIVIMAAGRLVDDVAIDEAHNIKFHLGHDHEHAVEDDVIVTIPALCEPSAGALPGRHLGLSLFSVNLESDRERSSPRP